jgi:transcriptional regulator with PAS, ATPase and Fis domain
LASKVGFSYAAVWQLKERYLKLVYDSIISGRKPFVNPVTETERKEVQEAEEQFPNVKIISDDSKINALKIKLPKLSKIKEINVDILLIGESGTGKELFAKVIHDSSGRAGDFVPVNCASIPESLFESVFFGHEKGAFTGAEEKKIGFFEKADGGTIFLDEIGELDLTHQKRFLRVLENREIQPVGGKSKKVDVKIVYATNKILTQMVANGSFRLDLYHRINEFPYQIPPLRNRNYDVPLLISHFFEKYTVKLRKNPKLKSIRVTDDCLNLLMNYNWKGNVRELENVIKKIIVTRLIDDDRRNIESSDLPEHILEPIDSEKFGSKPKKGRKKRPSDEVLIRLKNDGRTQEEVAGEFLVVRETANRWYADIRKQQSQQNQSFKN